MTNVERLHTQPRLREVMTNSDMNLPAPCERDAVAERFSDACYRHLGARDTAGRLADITGQNPRTTKAYLLRDNTPTLPAYSRLVLTLGDAFHRDVMGLPPDVEREELLKQVNYLMHCIRTI